MCYMKICDKQLNKSINICDSNCYKYSSESAPGKSKYFIAAQDGNGRVYRQEINKNDFKDMECRLVDMK